MAQIERFRISFFHAFWPSKASTLSRTPSLSNGRKTAARDSDRRADSSR